MERENYKKIFLLFLFLFISFLLFLNSNLIFLEAQDIFKEISNFLRGNLNYLPVISTSTVPSQTKSDFSLSLLPYLEKEITGVVKKASPAVVSIVVNKYVPIIERYYSNPFEEFEIPPELEPFFKFDFQVPQYRTKGYEKEEISGGTGFIVSSDGLILTNEHVVDDDKAEYVVYLNDGRKFKAKVLLKHPVDDLALIKIDAYNLPTLPLGNSDNLQIGEFVIAIGNALGELQNTVSFGVISGLKRNIVASDSFGKIQRLEDLIQTDAAINYGNSGGPLINIYGEAIGVNTAIVSGAQNIGFAIPINRAKRMIEEWKTKGKIEIPFLGIKYILVDKKVKEKFNLPYSYGAYVYTDIKNDKAVIPNSPAERAGIKEGDLILEIDGEKITLQNTLAATIRKKKVGDIISLKIWREGKILEIKVTLGRLPENLLSQ